MPRAIGRFTALTELYLCHLTLDEGSLQDLSGLPSLQGFRGKWLICSQSDFENFSFLAGPRAQALWAVALGWPRLLDFELTECTFKSCLGDGEIQTTTNSLLRRLHIDDSANAARLMSGISALQDLQHLHISVDGNLGSIGRLRSLTSLVAEFRHNELADYIELGLQNPKLQLLHLTASGNADGMEQDEQTWQSLSALSSLRSLQLYDFQLADLPAEVVLLTKLTSLCIDNGLRSMSRDLSPLENLVQLRLSCECLSSLPPMLSTCRSLEELVLTECRMEISSEPVKALKDLPRLQQIILDMYSLGADKGERERAFMRLARELPSVKLSFQSE